MQQMVIYWPSQVPQHVSGTFTPIIRRADCVSLPVVLSWFVAVLVPVIWVARCVHCYKDVAWLQSCNILLTVRTSRYPTRQNQKSYKPGHNTTGSNSQSALLMMGVKVPKHVEELLNVNKSPFVISSCSHLHILLTTCYKYIKLWSMKLPGHVACMEAKRNAYRFWL
jgi:hypothetical protein